ncbi:MAG TPA: PAS domain S-box protein [Prolixibacteraceae bacterium]|nr:PAS domain S-box protein [Prolixibacteraceae bacterium]
MNSITSNQQKPFDILVVDDTPANLKLLVELLSEVGYHIRPANSGELALRSIKAAKPDLILLDVKMDGLDGYEVCKRLKADESTADIPVIFISALDDEPSKVTGFEVGGVDFISKPFRKEEVLARVKTHLDLHLLQRELKTRNQLLEEEVLLRKKAELAMEKRMVALTQPLENDAKYEFDELFNLNEIQKLQDQFAAGFGVASIITNTDGTPITKASNFSRLCQNIIRCTETGLKNCMHSDAVIGRQNTDAPIVQQCLSGGLWDAGASITVGGKHIANWLIGQVRDENQTADKMKRYAAEIGAHEKDFMEAFDEIPSMSQVQFHKIADVLFTMAGQLSDMAYQNMQQAHFINDKKTAEIALSESEERYRTTLYSIGDGVITTDEKGRVQLMNTLAEELTGWKQEEATGKMLEEVFQIINEETLAPVEIPIRKVLRDGVVVGLANHTVLIAKDGTYRPIADSGAPIKNAEGKIKGVVLVFQDKTEEHKISLALEASERKFRSIVESSPIGMYFYELQPDGKLIFNGANPAADKIIGTDHNSYIGKTIQEAFPNLANTNVPEMYSKVATGEMDTQQFEIEYHDEQQINGIYSVTVFQSGENFVTIKFIDISEQKNAELAIKKSEERFHGLFEHATVGFSMTKPGGEININPAFANMLGYEPKDLKQISWKEITHPDDIQISMDVVDLLQSGKQNRFRYDKRYIHKNGTVVWADVSTMLIRDEKGVPLYFITNINDLTQRKEAEAKLQKSENRFRKLVENGYDMISLLDGSGHMTYSSPSIETVLGKKVETLIGNYFTDLVHPDDHETLIHLFTKIIQASEHIHFGPIRVQHNSGAMCWIEGTANNLLADPDVNAIVVNFRDITQRKLAEEKLLRSEQELKKAQQITHIGSWYLDVATNEVVWTEELYKMYGFDPSLPVPPYTEHKKLFTPESWDLLSASLAHTSKTGIHYELELKTVKKDGSNGWMWVRGESIQNAKGKTIGLWGAAQDISERKKAEETLRESELKYRSLIENTSDVVFCVNEKGEYQFTNQVFASTFGKTPDYFIGKTFWDIYPKEEADYRQATNKKVFETGLSESIEVSVPLPDRTLYFIAKANPIKDETGKVILNLTSAIDVTARKLTEQALVESEEKFSKSFLNAPILISITDLETGVYIDVNEESLRVSGFDRSEVIGHTASELGWISAEVQQQIYSEIQSKGRIVDMEINFRAKDGSQIAGIVNGELFYLKGRKCLLTTSVDITDRKKIEEEIKKERTLLRTLIDHLPDTVYVKDLEGRKLITNKTDVDFIGKSFNDVLKKTDIELFEGEIGQHGFDDDMRVMQTGEPMLNVEEHFIDNRGEKRWLVTTKIPLRDSAGRVYGLVGTGRDVTGKQRDHETIQKLSKSIEQSPSSIVITNVNGNIEYVNPQFTIITGYSAEEVIGKNPRILKSGEMPDEKYKELWDTISTGGVWRGEFHNRKKDGELYWEWATMTSIKDDQGEIINYIAIKEDISLRKQMETDLVVAKEKAEENDRLKSAFLANMSHEIRTPLNCILGFTELMTDPDIESEERLEYSKLIVNSGNNLLSIINDILDISKIESGQVHIKRSKFPIQRIIKEVVNEFEHRAAEQGILFKVDPDLFKKEMMIVSDDAKLKQVLINFVSNALKFTEKGFIEIGLKNEGNSLQLFVKDTGIGIPKESHENIFERFRQVETAHTRKFGGNGLGLAISKSLIELLGGTIGMESEVGKGSTFNFSIPII